MADTETYPSAPPQVPERGGWPISAWIIPDVLLGFALTVVLTVVLVAASLGIRLAAGDLFLDPPDGLRMANGRLLSQPSDFLTPAVFTGSLLMQNLSFMAIVALRVRALRRRPWAWLGVQARNPGRLTLIGVGLGVAFLVLNVVSGLVFSRLLGIEQNQAEQFPISAGDVLGQALVMIAATAIAPIGEEFFFRGYVFHALKYDLGKVAAYVGSAALFSAVHIFGVTQGAPALLIPLFFGGLLLAWAVDYTGSLLPSIIAHGINNGVAMALLLTCTNNPLLCQAT
jgi:membrane protease YdiL (CAAX protease family)